MVYGSEPVSWKKQLTYSRASQALNWGHEDVKGYCIYQLSEASWVRNEFIIIDYVILGLWVKGVSIPTFLQYDNGTI